MPLWGWPVGEWGAREFEGKREKEEEEEGLRMIQANNKHYIEGNSSEAERQQQQKAQSGTSLSLSLSRLQKVARDRERERQEETGLSLRWPFSTCPTLTSWRLRCIHPLSLSANKPSTCGPTSLSTYPSLMNACGARDRELSEGGETEPTRGRRLDHWR